MEIRFKMHFFTHAVLLEEHLTINLMFSFGHCPNNCHPKRPKLLSKTPPPPPPYTMPQRRKNPSEVFPYPCSKSLDQRILLAEVVEKVVGNLVDS